VCSRPVYAPGGHNIEVRTARLAKRQVSSISPEEVAEILAKIFDRAEPHSEHVQRVLSSMWSHLAKPAYRRTTGVIPYALRGVRAPERTSYEIGDPDAPDFEALDAPPSEIELGRAVAIAKSGAFGPRASAALLVLAGSVQRRRAIVGMHRADFRRFGDEECWSMPPYSTKKLRTMRKMRRLRRLTPKSTPKMQLRPTLKSMAKNRNHIANE
jgi:hypothetical protein